MKPNSPLAAAALAAAVGALLTLGIGFLAFDQGKASDLVAPLVIAVIATIAVTAFAARRLPASSLRVRFASVAAFASLIGLINLVALSSLMLVSQKDAALVAALLVYSTAAAVGAGVAVARRTSDAIEQVVQVSGRIAAGDLTARAGTIGGGRELEDLAGSLDEMAARLERSLESERSTEQRRRDLVVAVSHDLRTPLAGLRAMAEAIEDGVVSDPETIGAYSSRMRGLVESLTDLVDDLFEFVQLDAGAIEAETERAKVADIVKSAVAACDAQALEKGLVLQTELGDTGSVACSPRLTRVIQNLLQNAIRHTPSDGTVLVVASWSETWLELAVEDTGEGIDEEIATRIFEPFWRGDGARAGEGSGLGLALAQRIVEALEGTIKVSSRPSGGARFTVLLPSASLASP